jgi:hypothetical protein
MPENILPESAITDFSPSPFRLAMSRLPGTPADPFLKIPPKGGLTSGLVLLSFRTLATGLRFSGVFAWSAASVYLRAVQPDRTIVSSMKKRRNAAVKPVWRIVHTVSAVLQVAL